MRLHKLNLHRVGRRPDWEQVPARSRNPWQQVAAATFGVLTPANVTSVLGATLVFIGLWRIYNDELFVGLVAITVGRVADIMDGMVAHATATKSALGEALDASIDKIVVILAIIVFIISGVVPLLAAVVIAVRNGANIVLTLLAKAQKRQIHPSRAGKLAGGLEWASLILFVGAALFAEQNLGFLENATDFLAYLALAMAIALGVVAIKDYGAHTFE